MRHDFNPDTRLLLNSHPDLKVTSNHPPISRHPDLTVQSKSRNQNHIPPFPLSLNLGSHTQLCCLILSLISLSFAFKPLPEPTSSFIDSDFSQCSLVYCSPFPQPFLARRLPGSGDPSPRNAPTVEQKFRFSVSQVPRGGFGPRQGLTVSTGCD